MLVLAPPVHDLDAALLVLLVGQLDVLLDVLILVVLVVEGETAGVVGLSTRVLPGVGFLARLGLLLLLTGPGSAVEFLLEGGDVHG